MEIRINKLLSSMGICSRREADRMTDAGRVSVGGHAVATGQKVDENADICIDGRPVKRETQKILIAYNKPAGIVCTTTDRYGKNDIVSAVGLDKRIYPVGRLDKDSTGLIFLTNEGALMNELTKASGRHEKEYVVKINKPVTEEFLRRMRGGLYLEELDRTTAVCKVWACDEKDTKKKLNPTKDGSYDTRVFRIILIQGLNRQIRRMCEACGARVVSLKRVRIMNVLLGSLPEGKYRYIDGEEYGELKRRLGDK